MSSDKLILIVEDDEGAVFGYTSFLSYHGYAVQSASTLKDARDAFESKPFDTILLDLKLPDGNALHWIPQLKTKSPGTTIIVISGINDIPTAVQATKNGADNFLTKPVAMDDLVKTIEKSMELKILRKKNSIRERLSKIDEPCFGSSKKMIEMLNYANVAAKNNSVVLLQGETGTGKGVLAKLIHENGSRRSEAFVELNCSGLKGELLKSELYGHAKGAFTSAVKEREGLLEVADGGTLFLDEIGDMDLEVQAQLLKTIEEQSFRRIGENRVRKSDFRLICATNRNLLEESKQNRFRSDLYYRICVFPISIPSLCERNEDIPELVTYFLRSLKYSQLPLAEEIITTLQQYRFPGNVRELKNMLERATLLSQGQSLDLSHFPGLNGTADSTVPGDTIENLQEIEKKHIYKILNKYKGNKKMASEALGMSFSNLYRRLQQYKESE